MHELARIVGSDHVLSDVVIGDVGVPGVAATLVRPADADQVAAVVGWCYAHDVAIVPVGGRSGLAGGAAVLDPAAVAVSLQRLDAVRSFEPELWRMHAEAGVTTATIARLARENGLLFPPDPGAPEQSQLGGMIATNAGGPHAFKYGVTGAWVTGLEAVLAPGELVQVGGALRKDVAGYDLGALLTGSEGTLGIVTAAWLRLTPAPEARLMVVAEYPDARAGCAAILSVLAGARRDRVLTCAPRGAAARLRRRRRGRRVCGRGRTGARRAARGAGSAGSCAARTGWVRAGGLALARRRLACGHRGARSEAVGGHRGARRPPRGGDRADR